MIPLFKRLYMLKISKILAAADYTPPPKTPPAEIRYHEIPSIWIEGSNELGACVKAVQRVLDGQNLNSNAMSNCVSVVYNWPRKRTQTAMKDGHKVTRIEVTKQMREAIIDTYLRK
jgi:hypothetical protein